VTNFSNFGPQKYSKKHHFYQQQPPFSNAREKTIFAPPIITKNETKAMLSNLSKTDVRREKQEKVFHTIIQVGRN